MGSFVFKWPYSARSVHVTGTFDDWGMTEQLNQKGEHWEKEVNLPSAEEKIYYKFVVDGNWIVDDNAPKEDDGHFNINNVLYPHEIRKSLEDSKETKESVAAETGTEGGVAASAAHLNTVSPDSSTAQMAGQVPEEERVRERSTPPPGAFPSAPATGPDTYGVAPIPASSGVGNPIGVPAGEKLPNPSEVTANTVDFTATTSKEDYEKDASAPSVPNDQDVSVKPIPATSGIGNPINLPAGEKVPDSSEVTTNTVDSTVTTSKEAYEHAGEGAAGMFGGAALGSAAASAFAKPEERNKENIIPESSLPMSGGEMNTTDAGPTISSAAPGTSTAGLAAGVPLEKKRQGMIIDPEDAPEREESPVPPEVKEEKSAMEKELLSKTQVSEATGEPASAATDQTSYYGLATSVPPTVEKSMQKAQAPAEAAADTSAVAEKTAMEQELLGKVPTEEASGEPAPTIAAVNSATAPSATLGTSSAAVAAVSDGTSGPDSETPTAAPTTVPTEKSEGDATEYVPPRVFATAPGVSPAAAAAVSDGTEDPTLADEPAVRMMGQPSVEESAPSETGVTAPDADPMPLPNVEGQPPTDTEVKPSADLAGTLSTDSEDLPVTSSQPTATSAAPKTYHDSITVPSTAPMGEAVGAPVSSTMEPETSAVPPIQQTDSPTAVLIPQSEMPPTAPTATETLPAAPIQQPVTPSAAASKTETPSVVPAKIETPSTAPAKQTETALAVPTSAKKSPSPTPPTSRSPASSTATGDTEQKKKKKNRLSSFFKKVFD